MSTYFILLCCLSISVNAEAEGPDTDTFKLGPFVMMGPFYEPLDRELAKYSPLEASDTAVSKRLLNVAKSLSVINHELGIFDSHTIPEISMSLPFLKSFSALSNIAGPIRLQNLNITGIRNGKIDDFELRKRTLLENNTFRVDLNVSNPNITAEFDYSLQSRFVLFDLTVSGTIKVKLKNVKASLALQLTVNSSQKEAHLEAQRGEAQLTAEDLQLEITYKSFSVKNLIHTDLVRKVVDQVKIIIMEEAGKGFKTLINHYFSFLPTKLAKDILSNDFEQQ